MKQTKQTITVQETPIAVTDDDYISLTDIAKRNSPEPDDVVKNWMRVKNTILLLGAWEMRFNPAFKPVEFDGFKDEAGTNAFALSPSRWVERTNAIGIRGRKPASSKNINR